VDIPIARTRFDLFATFVLIIYAAILTVLVGTAFTLLDGTALLVVLIVLVMFWLFWSGLYVFAWTGCAGSPTRSGCTATGCTPARSSVS
jgi:hypothetical protein